MKNRTLYIILGLIVVYLFITEYNKTEPTDYTQTYKKEDKIPFGAYALYHILQGVFPNNNIETSLQSIYNKNNVAITYNNENNLNSNYIIITDNFDDKVIDKYELDVLLNYTSKGNMVFIAANTFNKNLLDTLYIETENYFYNYLNNNLVDNCYEINGFAKELTRNFVATNVFENINDNAKILATFNQKPVMVKFNFGEGSLILSTTPKLLSNYFILKKDDVNVNNYLIAESKLKFLPNQKTFWDEHYKFDKIDAINKASPLRYILSQKALKWAMYTFMASMLIYIFVKAKRLQSIIPVIKKEPNLDLDFAKTIGTLYYNEGNNLNLAKKKILYWKEIVRKKLNLNTNILNEDFENKLNRKTNLEAKNIFKLLFTIKNIENAKQNISNGQLISLNKQLENFYKNI